MTVPDVYSEWTGYQVQRVTADAAISASGVPVVIEAIGIKSGGTAAVTQLYNGAAIAAANIVGGISGVANGWAWDRGMHTLCPDGCYVDFNAGTAPSDCVVVYRLV